MKITMHGILKAIDCHLGNLSHFIMACGLFLIPLTVPQTLITHGINPLMLLVGCFATVLLIYIFQVLEVVIYSAFALQIPDHVATNANRIFALFYVGAAFAATINEPAHTTSAYIAMGVLYVVSRAILDLFFGGNPLGDWVDARWRVFVAAIKNRKIAA